MDLHAGGAATEAPALGGDWGEASGANNSICDTITLILAVCTCACRC